MFDHGISPLENLLNSGALRANNPPSLWAGPRRGFPRALYIIRMTIPECRIFGLRK